MAGMLWRRTHDVVVVAFAVLLTVAGVLGYVEGVDKSRDDSITEIVGAGYGIDYLRPGEVVIVGARVRIKDPITITAIEPRTRINGEGSVLDAREMNAGSQCISGWPLRTIYVPRLVQRPLEPGDYRLGLFLRPEGTRLWSSDGLTVRYERDGRRHSQHFDGISWELTANPDNRGCAPLPFPAMGWDAPVDSDPHHVLCISAYQLNMTFTHPDMRWPADRDVRAPLAPFFRTIATWAPDASDSGVRAAGATIGEMASRRSLLLLNETLPVIGNLLTACEAAGGFAPYPFTAPDTSAG